MPAVKHIALFNFKAGTSQEQIDKVLEELLDLSEMVPGVQDYVAGTNNSPENLNQGFTHGFVMTFENVAARDAYLPHPDHERVKASVLPFIDSVLVLDFEI
jgi:Stress responsive A/B Barrel Domain